MGSPVDDILDDLTAEYERLDKILSNLSDNQWTAPSGVPGWSVHDVVIHLALTEEEVSVTLGGPGGGWRDLGRPLDAVIDDQVRQVQSTPPDTLARWQAAKAASLKALHQADRHQYVRWAAAPLKPRTLATTRLAEHWAHGLDITEPLGIDFPDTARLRHIAWLGWATLPYAMRLEGLEPVAVHVQLVGPGGELWEFGPPNAGSRISGPAGAFCRVGARRLSAHLSGLTTAGPHAADALRVLRNYAA